MVPSIWVTSSKPSRISWDGDRWSCICCTCFLRASGRMIFWCETNSIQWVGGSSPEPWNIFSMRDPHGGFPGASPVSRQFGRMLIFGHYLQEFHGGWISTRIAILGGGNSNIFLCSPLFGGNDPIWRSYVSNGLVQPPTSIIYCI